MRAMFDRLAGHRHDLMVYGLAVVPLIAGMWKLGAFTVVDAAAFSPAVWEAYNPSWFTALLPVSLETWTLAIGVVETAMGVVLLARWKTPIVACLAAGWLLSITVVVGSAGFYDVALRDLGLAVFALVVALDAYQRT